MDDLDDPTKNEEVDHFVPESGPGQEAANFSAKAQQEKFLGGSSSENKQEFKAPGKEGLRRRALKAVREYISPHFPLDREAFAETERFSPEAREALEKKGFVIYE